MNPLPPVAGIFFLLSVFVKLVYGSGENFGEQFVGSPLLILVVVIVIAALASLYHRIRK